MQERTRLSDGIQVVRAFQTETEDAKALLDMVAEEEDPSLVEELSQSLKAAAKRAETAELEALLSGEMDGNDTYLQINAGAGGTESQDWAGMLRRMYIRWAERQGYKIDVAEAHEGDEAGIKSTTLVIKGKNAFGWLKSESGVHRLVRISPFDSNARRHTSFASVWVYPVIDDRIEIDINEADVRTDTYRASGAGGQHVNKTDSAVRLTHIPTGIVVACQNGRSQHKNKETAWNMLRARLYEAELQKQLAVQQETHEAKSDIGWGHQIRSYVMQPYQLVKDLRTDVETSNISAVLDGDLDVFLTASLSHMIDNSPA